MPGIFPRKIGSEKAYYIRKMSNTIRANQQEEQELFMLANNVPFDDRSEHDSRHNRSEKQPDLGIPAYSRKQPYEQSLSRPLQDVATDMRLLAVQRKLQTSERRAHVFQ